MMKTIFNFSSVIVCLISLVLLVPIAGVQETQAAENQERSQEEITAEKERLETKIADLESRPLDYFGSQKNKRAQIGFYKYRLELLLQDPDKYFSEPEKFEGNIKASD
jgi:peptidoglycan hydrolase CwlO-like protein